MKKILLLFLVIPLFFFLVSCSETTSPGPDPKLKSEPSFDDDPILIESNGALVRKAEFLERLSAVSSEAAILQDKDAMKDALKQFLEEKVLLKKAGELGYEEDADYQTLVYRIDKSAKIQKRTALIRTMFIKEVEQRVEVDETKLIAFFKKNRKVYELRIVSEILRIVIHPDEKAEVEKVRKEIDMIYAKLKKGEKFEVLVEEYYNGSEFIRKAKGSLGVIKIGKYPKDFERVAYSELKKVGDISKPFLYNQGWSILRLDKIYTYEEMKVLVKRDYVNTQKSNINRELVDEYLKDVKKLKYHDLEIEKIINP